MGLLESITSAVIYGRLLSDLLTLALIRLCKQFSKATFSFQTCFTADVSQRSQHVRLQTTEIIKPHIENVSRS